MARVDEPVLQFRSSLHTVLAAEVCAYLSGPLQRARKGLGTRPKTLVSQVLKAVSQSDAMADPAALQASTFGRCRVAAGMVGRPLGAKRDG